MEQRSDFYDPIIPLTGVNVPSIPLDGSGQAADLRLKAQENLLPERDEPDAAQQALPPVGLVPPGSWIPYAHSDIFTGRAADMQALAGLLMPEEQGLFAAHAALIGPAGIGKTRLAVEFCLRWGARMEGVHWVSAGAGRTIEAEIAACGMRMNILPWPAKIPEQVEAVLKAWQASSHLVVIDGADEPRQLESWLVRMGSARVLVLSRSERWASEPGIQVHRLNGLTDGQGAELLRRLAPNAKRASEQDLRELSGLLNGQPLALQFAGRWLGKHILSSTRGLISAAEKALQKANRAAVDGTAGLVQGMMALSVEQIDGPWEENRCARRMLLAAAYLAPNAPIPPALLRDAAGLPESKGELVERAMKKLAECGLIEPARSGPMIGAALSDYLRSLGNPKHASLSAAAEALARMAYQSTGSAAARQIVTLRPHLFETAARAEACSLEQTGPLWNSLGYHMWAEGLLEQARMCFARALQADETLHGRDSHELTTGLNNLGTVLYELGDLEGAQSRFERALTIDEQVGGRFHPNLLADLHNLRRVLADLGDLSGVKRCLEVALEIEERVSGLGRGELAVEFSELGARLQAARDYDTAKECYQRALSLNEALHGPESPQACACHKQLLRLHRSLGEPASVKLYAQRALAIDEKIYGPTHAEIASDANRLGMALYALGELPQARDCFARALVIDEGLFGPWSDAVSRDVNNLGNAYQAMDDLESAKTFYTRALAVDEKLHGADHPATAASLNNLGKVLFALGELQQARVCFERVLTIDIHLHGHGHVEVATDTNNLGRVLQDLGDYQEAMNCFSRALMIYQQSLPEDHRYVRLTLRNLERVEKLIARRKSQ